MTPRNLHSGLVDSSNTTRRQSYLYTTSSSNLVNLLLHTLHGLRVHGSSCSNTFGEFKLLVFNINRKRFVSQCIRVLDRHVASISATRGGGIVPSPPHPTIPTQSPFFNFGAPALVRASHTVIPAHRIGATSAIFPSPGILTAVAASKSAYSAKNPSEVNPRKSLVLQN